MFNSKFACFPKKFRDVSGRQVWFVAYGCSWKEVLIRPSHLTFCDFTLSDVNDSRTGIMIKEYRKLEFFVQGDQRILMPKSPYRVVGVVQFRNTL